MPPVRVYVPPPDALRLCAMFLTSPTPLSLLLLALLCCAACDDALRNDGPPDGTYTARGRVADITGSEVWIQHEAIEDFHNREGQRVGMESMTMGFHRPPSISMEGIGTDDLVRFTFEVRWDGDYPMSISAIEKLPPGTALAL